MNKKLCILLVLAVLCSTVFAGKSKEKSKEKSNESKERSNESKEKSDESKSKEDSSSGSDEAQASTTTVAAEVTEAATEAPTDEATDATTDATTETVTETEESGGEPTANELKGLCKGVIVDMKPHPGKCNKFVICVLGKATIQSCGKFQVFNKEVKFCTFGDPKNC